MNPTEGKRSLFPDGSRVVTNEGAGVVVAADLEPEFPYPPAVRVQIDGEENARWFPIEDVRRGD